MTLAVFRSYVAPERRVEYDWLYNRMHVLIQQSPSHIEHKMFTAEDGGSALIVEFDDRQSLEERGEKPDYRIAKTSARGTSSRVTTSQSAKSSNVMSRAMLVRKHLPSIAPS